MKKAKLRYKGLYEKMIRKITDSKSNLYYVFCGDWESIIQGGSAHIATSKALTMGFDEFNEQLSLSAFIQCLNLTGYSKTLDFDENMSYFYMPEMLADIGKHELCKKFSTILKYSEDSKGKPPSKKENGGEENEDGEEFEY